MSVVCPRVSGMMHSVSNTWEALKNFATMFERINAISQNTPDSPRFFPRGPLALTAAQDSPRPKLDISNMIDMSEAGGKRSLWSSKAPGSVLLLPAGQSVGAVADIWDVGYDAQSGAITLELDVVNDPHTIGEFEPHGKQVLDVDRAHYHFVTAPGVKVDAGALLKSLQDPAFKLQGMHVFGKHSAPPMTCYQVSISGSPKDATVGQNVTVTVTLDDSGCVAPNATANTLADDKATAQADVASSHSVLEVELMLVGPAEWIDGSRDLQPVFRRTPKPGERSPPYSTIIYPDFDANLVAYGVLTVTGDGPIAVQANEIFDPRGMPYWGEVATDQAAYTFFNAGGQCNDTGSAVVTLELNPVKAYRHIHDIITLTAVAHDVNGAPVQGVTVVFAAHGDCDPRTTQQGIVTDASGKAAVTLAADMPGAVSVVAATVGVDGAPVVSAPSVIFFFDDHHHRDEREKQFYERDTQTYAAAAAKLAKEHVTHTLKAAEYN